MTHNQPLPFQPVQPPAAPMGTWPASPPAPARARSRPARRRRVFFWIFLAMQVLGLIFTVASAGSGPGPGCTGDCAAAVQTSQGQNLLDGIELWAGLDVVVFTCWAAWKLA